MRYGRMTWAEVGAWSASIALIFVVFSWDLILYWFL